MNTVAAPRTLPRRRWRFVVRGDVRAVVMVAVIALACVLAITLVYRGGGERGFDIGATDTITGMFPPERNDHFSYAFLRDRATFDIPNTGWGAVATTIRMGGPDAQASVAVGIGTPHPLLALPNVRDLRTYYLLLPANDQGIQLGISSTVAQPTGETRQLGALLDRIDVRSVGTMLPPSSVWWACPLALMLVYALSGLATRRTAIRIALVVGAAFALIGTYGVLRWRYAIVPAFYFNTLIVLAITTLVVRTLAVPRRRAALVAARWFVVPLLIFLATRLGILVVAYIADPLMRDGNDTTPPITNVLVQVLTARWDSAFYYDIVYNGYFFDPTTLSNVAFFPLLPLLIRSLAPVFGSAQAAGIIVVNAALLGAVVLLYRLVDMEWGAEVAERAVWYLLIFPLSFFGSFVYTESLLLLTSIGALYCARRGYWGIAAALGIGASLSRFVGIVVAPMLLVEWWMQRRGTTPPSRWAALAACAVPLGTGMYMFFLWQHFGDPIAFIHASATWGRAPGSPLAMIGSVFDRPNGGWIPALLAGSVQQNNLIDLGAVLAFVALSGVLLVQRRWSEAIFMLGAIAITFNSGLLASQRRYVWVLFPAFILLARWGQHQWVDRVITAVFLICLGLFTAMIANHYWVA